MCGCACMKAFTDAVVSEVSSQALPLVLWIVLPLPGLILFTGQTGVLRLPLQAHNQTTAMFINSS